LGRFFVGLAICGTIGSVADECTISVEVDTFPLLKLVAFAVGDVTTTGDVDECLFVFEDSSSWSSSLSSSSDSGKNAFPAAAEAAADNGADPLRGVTEAETLFYR
jgi:hypothetical protein